MTMTPIDPVVGIVTSDSRSTVYTCPTGKRFAGYVRFGVYSGGNAEIPGEVRIEPSGGSSAASRIIRPRPQGMEYTGALINAPGLYDFLVPVFLTDGELLVLDRMDGISQAYTVIGWLEDDDDGPSMKHLGSIAGTASQQTVYTCPADTEMIGHAISYHLATSAQKTVQIWHREASGTATDVNKIHHRVGAAGFKSLRIEKVVIPLAMRDGARLLHQSSVDSTFARDHLVVFGLERPIT